YPINLEIELWHVNILNTYELVHNDAITNYVYNPEQYSLKNKYAIIDCLFNLISWFQIIIFKIIEIVLVGGIIVGYLNHKDKLNIVDILEDVIDKLKQ